ncbi:MAG: MlaE family lipid ABC transporter permease subunit [Tahibacter sp.]
MAADIAIDHAGGDVVLRVSGDWTLANAASLDARVRKILASSTNATRIDVSGLGRLDTTGAQLLLALRGDHADPEFLGQIGEERSSLLHTVSEAMRAPVSPALPQTWSPLDLLERIGRGMQTLGRNALQLLGFVGLVLQSFAASMFVPRRWRTTSLVFHIEQTGLDAVPIVALLSFLIGAVIAFLGATVLRDFGATLFTVELVSYSFLREFGVLLTAILIAGRSGSAFTAQIGSMKMREEIDAIRTLGLDPVHVLVLPRVLALVIAMPLLSFLAIIAGIIGGAAVCALSLDISPTMFISRFQETTTLRHLWVGLGKAPIFAFLIAAIGCLEGFKVSGSAESVGEHTTSSVVQSIFVVILVDALAAIFFMEIDV